jgi:hypothetical protein
VAILGLHEGGRAAAGRGLFVTVHVHVRHCCTATVVPCESCKIAQLALPPLSKSKVHGGLLLAPSFAQRSSTLDKIECLESTLHLKYWLSVFLLNYVTQLMLMWTGSYYIEYNNMYILYMLRDTLEQF